LDHGCSSTARTVPVPLVVRVHPRRHVKIKTFFKDLLN
jgi:hypothetical protein